MRWPGRWQHRPGRSREEMQERGERGRVVKVQRHIRFPCFALHDSDWWAARGGRQDRGHQRKGVRPLRRA